MHSDTKESRISIENKTLNQFRLYNIILRPREREKITKTKRVTVNIYVITQSQLLSEGLSLIRLLAAELNCEPFLRNTSL